MIHIYIIFFRTFKLNLWKPQLRLQLQFYFFLLLFFSFIPESSLASAPSHRDRRPLADQRLTAGLLTQLRAANNRGAWSSITHPWLYLHFSQQRLPHTDTSSQKSINTCSKSPCPPPSSNSYHCVTVQTGISPHLSCFAVISMVVDGTISGSSAEGGKLQDGIYWLLSILKPRFGNGLQKNGL